MIAEATKARCVICRTETDANHGITSWCTCATCTKQINHVGLIVARSAGALAQCAACRGMGRRYDRTVSTECRACRGSGTASARRAGGGAP